MLTSTMSNSNIISFSVRRFTTPRLGFTCEVVDWGKRIPEMQLHQSYRCIYACMCVHHVFSNLCNDKSKYWKNVLTTLKKFVFRISPRKDYIQRLLLYTCIYTPTHLKSMHKDQPG